MMSLENWKRFDWINTEAATLAEIVQLFAVVNREIHDAAADGLSDDGRFMHAYDAALTLCNIALRASGYRVKKGGGHHKRMIESLPLTMGHEFKNTSDEIEIASRQRGQAMYDRAGVVEKEDADSLLVTAIQLRADIIDWLRLRHPKLLPNGL